MKMKNIFRRAAWLGCFATACSFAQSASAADDYPNKPIHLVVPWSVGGFNDMLARLLAEKMSTSMGQQIIVENRPGAAGTLGSEYVARAKPDGYTLLLATADTHAISKAIFAHLRYDPQRDFTPISLIVSQPVILWVSSESDTKNFADLLKKAKENPGKVSYASNGAGSVTHLGMESFAKAANISLLHVPYKGSGPAMIDLMGNRVDAMFMSIQAAGSQATSGKLTPLAVTAEKRVPAMPNVPTFTEAGIPFKLALWQGLVAPKGVPADIVNRLAQESAKALKSPEIMERMQPLGVDVIASDPATFKESLAKEITEWKEIADELGVQLD